MNRKKDMFTQFREQSREIRIKPRPQLWERLEDRLDNHRRRTRRRNIRNLVMAATLAMLAVSSVLLLLKLNQIQQKLQAARGFQLAELPYPAEAALPSAPAQPVNIAPADIAEGHPQKRLFVNASEREIAQGMAWFTWIEGEWENPHQKGTQETWTLHPEGGLQGSLDYGKNPSMRIWQERNGRLQFSMVLEEGGNPRTYTLTYQDHHQAIFENPDLDFPRQVVIQRLGPSHLGFVYRNETLDGLTPGQAAYLAQHHRLQAQQISRQLFRIADQPM